MRILAIVVLVAAVATTFGVLHTRDASADSTFLPTSGVKFCNALPVSFSDPALAGNSACANVLTPGATTARTYDYASPIGNLNLHTLVTFSPNATVPGGAFGDKVAGARWVTMAGVTNGACNSMVTIDFVLYKVDPASAPSYPLAPGTGSLANGRFDDWRVGSTAVPGDGGVVPDISGVRAGPTSIPLTNVPQYVLDAFSPATPAGVYGGLTEVAGQWMPLYLAEFAPGTLAAAPGAFGRMYSAMGAPLVWVLGDPTTPVQQSGGFPFGVSDYCDTMGITMMLSATTNPAAGTVFFLQYAASERDLDQDGYENAIDTCPLSTPAPGGSENPRATPGAGAGDTDDDGIMNSCDSDLPAATGSDIDGDGEVNRYDNCPQVANNGAAQSDSSETGNPPDFGPRFDRVGDACDSGSITITQNNASVTINLSPSVANGRYHARTNLVPRCIGNTDNDGDGFCTSGGVTTDNADSGACASTSPNSCYFRHASFIVGACATNPVCQMDSDGDSVVPAAGSTSTFTDAVEAYLGTDPTKPCAADSTSDNEGPLDNWPLDLNDNRGAAGNDWLREANAINSTGGSTRAVNMGGNGDGTASTPATLTMPFLGTVPQTRFDLNWDGQLILGSDLGKFGSYMNKSCGGLGAPPIVNGCRTTLASAASIGNTTIVVADPTTCYSGGIIEIEFEANAEWVTIVSVTNGESGASCSNAVDDDGDGVVNDGCPIVGSRLDYYCSNSVDDDGDGAVNDGCPAVNETVTLASPLASAHASGVPVGLPYQQ
jgi:hypothetical protein